MTYDEIFDRIDDDVCKKFPDFSSAELTFVEDNSCIEKGKYQPIICYAITLEGSCLVTDFFVVCVDKKTHTDFIGVEYDQRYGKEGVWRYI